MRNRANLQQNIVLRRTPPSLNSIAEGQIVFALNPNKGLNMYTKQAGQIFTSSFHKQREDQIMDTVEVRGKAKFLKDLTIYGDLNLKGATIVGVASTVTTATHQDAYDVRGISIIPVDTSSNVVRFGGFANGVSGQIIHIVQVGTGNNVVLEADEGSGTQKIKLSEDGDKNWDDYGSFSLFCDGTNWFQLTRNIL